MRMLRLVAVPLLVVVAIAVACRDAVGPDASWRNRLDRRRFRETDRADVFDVGLVRP